MITLDTSGLVAYLNVRDPYHDQVTVALQRERGPYIIPVGILAEIAYFIEQLHPAVLNALLEYLIEKSRAMPPRAPRWREPQPRVA